VRGPGRRRRHGADLAARVAPGGRRQALFADFQDRFPPTLDPRAFFVAKTLEMRQRHTKFENTPYSLEPNCKESPGGLRDLQVILWVAKAAGFGDSWDELARSGLATPSRRSRSSATRRC
jgi:[protein-PII] uridylyltransferase